MAKTEAVWGIDIGNSSLKALRCRQDDRPDRVAADAFDYIEYPKILTQPGAEPAELVSEALSQFQSRNNVRGDRVAIAVSGQSGLARFIKLPPVEAKRIPDIVRYEARQQIPFDLNDVVWDYQRMGGGIEEEGFVLEAEVGLFAMKRDQVFRALEPFRKAGVEVDFVQLTPLALYNCFAFDQIHELPPPDEYDAGDPPSSYVMLSMGTDATDLVITDGYRVWQRSIPLGGNHFTKALTRELKLTFAKAEHLKRNAASAQDPKAVFQAMRPVFNDLLTEIQRSITYFTSINRTTKITQLVTLGNAMKLPGLRRYLSQSLGYEAAPTDSFRGLVGPEVVGAPAFKENRLCFGTCYGLAIQALGRSALKTNLLPQELVKDRMVREKKPWAVAAAAVLLLGFAISFVGLARGMGRMGTPEAGPYSAAEGEASSATSTAANYKSEADAAKAAFEQTNQIGKNLVASVEGRIQWLELFRAINGCLPSDPSDRPAGGAFQQPDAADSQPEDLVVTAEQIMARDKLYITSLEPQHWPSLAGWFAGVQRFYEPLPGEPPPPVVPAAAPPGAFGPSAPPASVPGAVDPGASDVATGVPEGGSGDRLSGPGWVISLFGHHYHNPRTPGALMGAEYVKEKLVKVLQDPETKVFLPKGDEGGFEWVKLRDLGIAYPVLLSYGHPTEVVLINPYFDSAAKAEAEDEEAKGKAPAGYPPTVTPGTYSTMTPGSYSGMPPGSPSYGPRAGMTGGVPEGAVLKVRRFNFVVQFSWQPTTPSERHQEQKQTEQPQPAEPAEPKSEPQP